jgi:hypothetical protein
MALKKGVKTVFQCICAEAKDYISKEAKVSMKFKVKVRESSMTIDFDFKDILRSSSV